VACAIADPAFGRVNLEIVSNTDASCTPTCGPPRLGTARPGRTPGLAVRQRELVRSADRARPAARRAAPRADQFCRCPTESRYGRLSVFVVVAFVGGVPVSVVDVVQMVAVEDGGVAASVTVHVDVLLGRLVHR
jgi:hypothetical protein